MTIEEFIEARLGDAERDAEKARAAVSYPTAPGESALWVVTGMDNAVGVDYDPEVVLRQAKAWRAVLAFGAALTSASQQMEFEDDVLRSVAAVWAKHEDCPPEWAVDGGGSKP